MSTDAPSPPRNRKRPRAWRGARIPDHLAGQLHQAARVSDQIWIIGHATEAEMARKITHLVGDEQARDIARDVTDKMATGAYTPVDGSPLTSPEGYNRLRGYLLTSAHNAAREHRRRLKTRSEVLVGEFTDTTVARAAERDRLTEPDDGLIGELDEAAIHDGLRRLDPLHARILHMKHIEGLKIREINDRLGFKSNGLYSRHYNRAINALLDVLTTYGLGGFCEQHGPYLLALRQEVDAGEEDERPLTALVGADRAREITFHVYGDPEVSSDNGCHACQTASANQQGCLHAINPLFLLPVAGTLGGLKGAVACAWGQVIGWIGGLFGGAGGGAAGAGAVAKGMVVAAAATTVVGGGIALERETHRRPPRPVAGAPTPVIANSAPKPTVSSAPVGRVAPSVAKPAITTAAASAAKKAKPAVRSKPELEFAPAPPRSGGPGSRRTPSRPTPSKAAAEFTP